MLAARRVANFNFHSTKYDPTGSDRLRIKVMDAAEIVVHTVES